MKKIIFGIAALSCVVAFNSFAATTVNPQIEVTVPCYNSGLGFGLAGFSSNPSNVTGELRGTSNEHIGSAEVSNADLNQTDYR